MSFGDRLRQARAAKGLKQEELGFAVGVTNSAVSAWENGRDVPSFAMLPKLRAALDVSLDELICGDAGSGRIAHGITKVFGGAESQSLPDSARAQNPKEYALLLRFRGLSGKRKAGLLDLLSPEVAPGKVD